MSAGSSVVSEVQKRAAVVVEPWIAAVIGDPAAPTGLSRRVAPPRELPGSVGLWPMLRETYGFYRSGVATFERQHQKYGEIYRSMSFAEPTVFVWDPHEIQKILRNEDGAWSAPLGWDLLLFDNLEPGAGNASSLLSLDFEAHRRARKLFQPAFTNRAIRGYIEITRRHIERAVADWTARGQVDFKSEVRSLLAKVAGDLFTGVREEGQLTLIDRCLQDVWNGVQTLSRNPRLSPAFGRAQAAHKMLRELFTALIPARRAQPGSDMFSALCQVEDRDGIAEQDMVRMFVSLMLAAYDTTAFGVTSMAYELCKHPEWQERLRREALPISASALDVASLQRLDQLEWAWKETLRLQPVAGFVPRRTLRDLELIGYRLPAGTHVAPMVGALGRHPGWWQEPLRFDPERFSPQRAEDKRTPNTYLPFGGGPHTCIGMQLASIEAKLLFHELLTKCRFELLHDYEAVHTFRPLGCVSGSVTLKLSSL